jgi:hypothetical protein
MKTIIWTLALSGQSFWGTSASFQNLGFDNANTNHVTCISLPLLPPVCNGATAELLPGWQLFNGNQEMSTIGLDLQPSGLGVASVYAFRPNTDLLTPFALGLFPGNDPMTQVFIPQVLVQVGDVPADARSIRFFNSGSPFELRVNNNFVPLLNAFPSDPSLPTVNVAGDISAFAGMNVELKLTTIKIPLHSLNGIDSISFSTEPVPEPGALSILALAVVFGACRRLCRFLAGDRACEC